MDHEPQKIVYSCPIDHDGNTVYIRGWLHKKGYERPPLIFVHDLFQNLDTILPFMMSFYEEGYHVYGFDLRGHGDTGQQSGHIDSFDALTNDLLQVVAWIKHTNNGRLPVLLAQGFGCLLGLSISKYFSHFIEGLVLATPTISLKDGVTRWERFFYQTLGEFFPRNDFSGVLAPPFIKILKKQSKTRLNLTQGTLFQVLNAISQAKKNMLRLSQKTLLIVSDDDPISHYDKVKRLIQKNKNPTHITLKTVNCTDHAPFTEYLLHHQEDRAFILQWIESPSA